MGNNPSIKDAMLQAMREWEKDHAFPPAIHFKQFHIPPSGWEYLGPDDHLQINIFTTATTTGLTLALRQLLPDGRVHYQQESLDGVATSTLTTKLFKLSEGWLIGAVVSNLGGGLADQVCWVSMALQRNFKSGTVPHTILQQGYVSNLIAISWPPSFSRGPAPGSGVPTLTEYETHQGGGSNVNTGSANAIRVALLNLPYNLKFSNIAWLVNVLDAVGLYSWGIYDLSGNLLAATPAATMPAVAVQVAAFTGAPFTLSAGNYLIAFTGNATTAQIGCTTTTGGVTGLALTSSATVSAGGVMPATIAVPAMSGNRGSPALLTYALF